MSGTGSKNQTIHYISTARLHRPRANVVQTLNMAQAFQGIGADIKLWVPPWKTITSLSERMREFGVSEGLPVQSSHWLHSRWRPWGPYLFALLNRRVLKRSWLVYVRNARLSRVLCRCGIAHAFEVHEIHDLMEQGNIADLVRGHQNGVIRAFFTISEAIRRVLIQQGADAERIHVSPSGVNLEKFAEVVPWKKEHLDFPRLCYIGRVSSDRGAEIFFELARRGVGKVTLIGPMDGDLQLPEEAIYQGAVPHVEVPSWYSRTDLVLLPYQNALRHADSISPIKLFESMAVGRPIIASDLPTIREVVQHEVNGLLVPPDDVDGWIGAVERLRRDRELAQRLAEKARQDARSYDWSIRAEKILVAMSKTSMKM